MERKERQGVAYRPPDSDSDDYDGFTFGDEIVRRTVRPVFAVDKMQDLYDAVYFGDLEKVKQEIERLNLNINEPVKSGDTLLLHACRRGHLDIVNYLVKEKHANVNKQVDSVTPILAACECDAKHSHTIEKIVTLLVKKGAVINVSDKYGTTPLMLACKNGHIGVIKLILHNASIEAVDNKGFSSLFHAIENNRPEVVKLLVEAGADTNASNYKGYKPLQVAQIYGFHDIIDILPKEKEGYNVPSLFLTYNTLRDYIPQIFLKSECPEYFQEVNTLLTSINMEKFTVYFAKERTSLEDFLTMNDKKLEDIGIDKPFFRKKIMKGLLDFHLNHWSKSTVAGVTSHIPESFYQLLMLTANHLQHYVIIKSAVRFIKDNIENDKFGLIPIEKVQDMKLTLEAYHATIEQIHETVEYLASFSPPKNPLFIDYDEYLATRKKHKLKVYFRYTAIFLGISVFVCLKIKKFF